jgi:Phytanoyl-CoA dioxygenase (PhyH)
LIRKYPEIAALTSDSPWLDLGLDDRILDVVNSYLGLWSKLYYFDLWYTLPVKANQRAAASQMWHRDPEDRKLVKVFLYFSEVDGDSGPLQYVPGSRRSGGPYSHLWRKYYQAYPPEGEFELEIPRSEWITGLASPGTFILVDTTGFHRGGFATKHPRLTATWTFVTPASYLVRRLRVQQPTDQQHLSAPAAFAIS